MHALILAAGDGGRLYPLTDGVPKPLLKVGGRPIINHVLDGLFANGIEHATIVTGYYGDKLRTALGNVSPCGMTLRFVENAAFELGNARSIWAARDVMPRDAGFVLAMGDHHVEPALTAALIAGASGRCRLAVDRAAPDDPRAGEATRARVRAGHVMDLGKTLVDWNALDTGAFWCTPAIFDAITPELRDGEAGAVFASLAQAGELEAVDVTGLHWIDIDTPHDLRAAEALAEARGLVA
jgi:CDP-L-myo-inositol myo-inositolphosphotransferase